MLGSQYLTINGTALHETSSFSMEYTTIENIFQTEAGTDAGTLTRANKLKMSVGWENCPSDAFRATILSYCALPTVTVVFNSDSYTMRARNYKEELVRYSNRYSGSNGIWNISMTLEEI